MHLGIIVGDLNGGEQVLRRHPRLPRNLARLEDGEVLSWTNMQVPDGDDYIEFMLYKDLPAPDHRGSQHHICLVDAGHRAGEGAGWKRAPHASAIRSRWKFGPEPIASAR